MAIRTATKRAIWAGITFGISAGMVSTSQAAMQDAWSGPGFSFCTAEVAGPGGKAAKIYVSNVMEGRVETNGVHNSHDRGDVRDNLSRAFERMGMRVFTECYSKPLRKWSVSDRNDHVEDHQSRRPVIEFTWSLPNGAVRLGTQSGPPYAVRQEPVNVVISASPPGNSKPRNVRAKQGNVFAGVPEAEAPAAPISTAPKPKPSYPVQPKPEPCKSKGCVRPI